MDRNDLPDLMAFVVIVEKGSFRRAAARLSVSPSAISHAIRRLEEKFGNTLLLRTTRSVAPTESGLQLLRTLKPAFDDIDRSLTDLTQKSGRVIGRVRINVHRNAAEQLILPRLLNLEQKHPDLKVELALDDGIVDIVAAGYDAGVRNGELLTKDMVAVRISRDYRSAVVAAPNYLQGRRSPVTPLDLHDHRCIGYRSVTSGALHSWRFAKNGRQVQSAIEPSLIIDDVYMAGRAALLGLGLSYVRRDTVADKLSSGELIEVLQDWSITIAGDFLYYPSRRALSPAMRAVVNSLRYR